MRKVRFGAIARRLLAGLAMLTLVPLALPDLAESGRRGTRIRRPGVEGTVRGRKRTRHRWVRLVEPYNPLRTRPENPGVQVQAPFEILETGRTITISVRLLDAPGEAHFASFHVSTDPAALQYTTNLPTGRGALLVKPDPKRPGEIAVYRSSLPEGFGPTEDLVQIQFELLAAGSHLVAVTGFRLLDGNALDLGLTVTPEAAEVRVD